MSDDKGRSANSPNDDVRPWEQKNKPLAGQWSLLKAESGNRNWEIDTKPLVAASAKVQDELAAEAGAAGLLATFRKTN